MFFGKLPKDLSKLCIVAFSDASLNTMPRNGSQGGFVIALAEATLANTLSVVCVLSWCSRRLKREVSPSMAAESIATSESAKHAQFLRAVLCSIFDHQFDVRHWERYSKQLLLKLVTDCRSVFDHLARNRGLPKDRFTAAELATVKRDLEEDDCEM